VTLSVIDRQPMVLLRVQPPSTALRSVGWSQQREPERSTVLVVTDELDPREAERIRRSDREAEAEARDLMRPGMGKVFKQILDVQAKAAREAEKRGLRKRS